MLKKEGDTGINTLITNICHPGLCMAGAGLISLLGLAGDLFESHLKRKHQVKDMGSILPGHGGILDRFDSLLFVSPALILILEMLKLLR